MIKISIPIDFIELDKNARFTNISNVFFNYKIRSDIWDWYFDEYNNGNFSHSSLHLSISLKQNLLISKLTTSVNFEYHDFNNFIDFDAYLEFPNEKEALYFKLRWV